MKELWSMWIDKLTKTWSKFSYYLYRKKWYKIKLLYRFSKCNYRGPWNMADPMLEISFEMLCEFYENGVNWKCRGIIDITTVEAYSREAIEIQNNNYRELERLYKWWKIEYKERQNEIDELLATWSEHHVFWLDRFHNDWDGYCEYFTHDTKYSKYLRNLLREEEDKFEKEKEANLLSLMKLRDFLCD